MLDITNKETLAAIEAAKQINRLWWEGYSLDEEAVNEIIEEHIRRSRDEQADES